MVAPLVLPCGVYGLVIGSFLNVVVHRTPRGESLVRPRSRCPQCGYQLRPADNVPVLSWLWLRGRCRSCSAPISVRYPAIELLTGVLFAAVAAREGPTWALPVFLLAAAVGVAVGAIDLEHRRIPTPIVYSALGASAAWFAVVAVVGHEVHHLRDACLGAVLARAPLWVANRVSPRGMGFGDVRFATLLGFVVGWIGLGAVGVSLFAAFASASVVGLALVGSGRRTRKDALPFGPFLVAGMLTGILWGPALYGWYTRLTGGV